MPTNTLYRSTLGSIDGIRYYFEIIPRSDTLLSSPTIEEFPLAALDYEWELDENMNDDKFGLKRPDGLNFRIDLEMLPADLKSYMLSPYVSVDMVENFPFKAPTRVDVPTFDLTNVFLVKTDDGNSSAAVDDFTIWKAFGLKKNPSIQHTHMKVGSIQKHKIDVVLHDIVRIICEAIHPIYFTWLGYNDVINHASFTPKTVQRVYDIVYSDHGPKDGYYNVKVLEEGLDTAPTSTTVDGVTLSVGERVLTYDNSTNMLKVWQLANATGPVYDKVRDVQVYDTDIESGEIFYVQSGTHADKNFRVITGTTTTGTFGFYRIINLQEFTVKTTLSRVIAKLDGNFNNVRAHYFPITAFNAYFSYVFNYFYKKIMRVTPASFDYSMTIHNNLMYAFGCYKQNYDRDYNVGVSGLTSTQLYFCAFVENIDNYSGGFLAENDGEFGIFEYENLWDLLENTKGQALNVSYYHDDKAIHLVYDSLRGEINQDDTSPVTLDFKDFLIDEDSAFEITENSDTKRGVVININVPGEDKNEHKFIKAGSISDEEASFKSMFHNNPSVNTDDDGWIESQNYPELKTSLVRDVYKQNNPEAPFDLHKLVYFDTPSTIADSEMAIRPHSACSVQLAAVSQTYLDTSIDTLPINDKFMFYLKKVFIDLQRFSGLPYNTAKRMASHFTANGRMLIEVDVPFSQIYKVPIMHQIILNIGDRLITNVSDRWLLCSKQTKNESNYVTVKLINR